jgi:hypothetical protein
MRPLAKCLLIVLLSTLTSPAPATARTDGSDEPSARNVEIPGAGAMVVLPRAWRTWLGKSGGQPTSVWTTDVETGQTCQFWSSQDLVSAQAAADALIAAPEAADIGISRGAPFEVPVGTAVLVTLGSAEAPQPPSHVQYEAYVDAPQGVVQIFCGAAPADFVRDVASTIAPLAPDYTPEPFDPRVERADHGFAVDFGPQWTVGFRFPGPLLGGLGGTVVLTASATVPLQDGPPRYTCYIEDESDVPGLRDLKTADDWKAAFIHAAEGRRGRELTTQAVELPSGPAIRADWPKYLSGMPTTAWGISDGDRVVVLMCHAKRPPADGWRSIAETIEFLPAAE